MSKHVYRLLQGLELFSKGRQVIFLTFPSTSKRNLLYDHLISLPVVHLEKMDLPDMTQKWQSGAVSNYEYLMFLNLLAVLCVCVCVVCMCMCACVCHGHHSLSTIRMADRSFCDIMQYPVMPWIIADYTSESIG